MANEWQQIQLGKVCLKIGSGATPRGGKDAYRGGNTALIRSQNIYNDRFTHEGLAYINDAQAHELRNVVVEKNDVLLNITGDSVARCFRADPNVLPARVNQHVAIIRTQPDVLDSRFLRYVLVSPSMQDHLLALASAGATRNALTKAMIESLSFQAPPIDEQRAIAHILGMLDDKIELNRTQNKTLEAMARALFKAWFVDFEPVRAKMDGRWQRGKPFPSPAGRGVRGEGPSPLLRKFAQENRAHATDAEQLMWQLLRNRQLGGKFRRQHPIAPYIADFYCHEHRLVIELDGGQHYSPEGLASDAARTAFLKTLGISVLRFSNREVLQETEGVLEAVWAALTPTPLPGGEGLYSLPAHLYDLFPDRLVESELGEIPEGWEIGRVSDFLSLAYGKSLPAGSRNPGLIPVYGSGGVTGYHDAAFVDSEAVIVGRKGTVGSLYWEQLPCFPIDTVFYVQPKVALSFCYHLLESLPLGDMNTDAAVPGLNRENVYRLDVASPPQALLDNFSVLAKVLRDQIFCLQNESRSLAQLRDTLLPKLISGELRVRGLKR